MEREEPGSGRSALAMLGLAAAVAVTVFVRVLHLANPAHYYILSQDSHFFHWQAGRALAGEPIPMAWHSGLTYPLAYGARLVSLLFGVQEGDALTLVGKVLPPAIGVAGTLTMYWGVSRLYGRRAALGAAFLWALLGYVYWTQAGGYLDRDGLSMVLLTAGVFAFHLSGQLHLKVRGWDLGWVPGSLAVVAVMALLAVEWLWLGALLLMVVLAAALVLQVVTGTLVRAARDLDRRVDEIALVARLPRHALSALGRSSWRQVALILGLSLAVVVFKPGLSYVGQMAADVASGAVSGTQEVGELQPLRFSDFLGYLPMAVPLLVGLYLALRRHRGADILCLAWLSSLLLLALFASRLMLYATPAACIIGGLGLAAIFNFDGSGRSFRLVGTPAGVVALPSGRFLRACLCGVLGLVLAVSPVAAYRLGDRGRIAADRGWQEALEFLDRETSPGAVVMSWWDYGYWILDMAGRRPVVDNGYYGWDEQRLQDVGRAYCTGDPAEAAAAMEAQGADYLVFSRWEVAVLPVISRYGVGRPLGDGLSVPNELLDSLYYQSLYRGFQGGGGLRRVYPASDVEEPGVMVLKRNVTATPAGM